MNRKEKAAAVDALTERLDQSTTIYLTDYSGLSVEESNRLRSEFRQAGVSFSVVKNTFLRLAMERLGGYDDLLDHLHGPTALAFTDDPAAPARIIREFADTVDVGKPELKVAFVEGSIFRGDQLDTLASLKSKEELVADIVGLLLAPMTNVVGALQAPSSQLMGAIKTLADRAES